MRVRRISVFVLIILLATGGIAWRMLQQPARQTIFLPDGSQLTLLKVTHGTNHVCRFGTPWQHLRDLFLIKVTGATIPARRAIFTSTDTNSVIAWLRHDSTLPAAGWPPACFVAVSENELESKPNQSAVIIVTLAGANAARSLPPGVRQGAGGRLASQIMGWELPQYPRRAKEFKIRSYRGEPKGNLVRIGEFTVRNPHPGQFPIWTSETLPATRTTNELEITLARLETGLTGEETGHGPAGEGVKSFSRATFKLRENGAPTEKWSVCGISTSNAAGEVRPGGSYGSRWSRAEHLLDFEGGLWLEESAWRLDVDFARTGDFPADELWVIKGVSVPRPGELVEARVVTNLHFTELEFLGVSGAKANLPEDYAGIQPHANIHARTPHPMDGLRLVLVDVRDDQGRKLETNGSTVRTSMGGRGNTPKEMLHGFAVEIPEDAKSLDVTFALTRVRHVEFLAKPVLFDSKSHSRN